MNIDTKLLIYKSLLRPLSTYGIQLWGAAKPSNTRSIQAFQSICLRLVSSSPWYITNSNLHKDLKIQTLNQISKTYYIRFHNKLQSHTNPLIRKLSYKTLPDNPRRSDEDLKENRVGIFYINNHQSITNAGAGCYQWITSQP